jgi:tetratricopeptide (TPR) repeat protein
LDILRSLNVFTFYVKSRESFYVLRKISSAALGLALLAPLAASAQLGPWPIQTKQTAFEASIVKRDQDVLWVERKSADGTRSPQIGLPVADVVQIGMPRPALFDAVEKIRLAPAATDAQFAAAHAALDKMILQLRSLRDLPGIPANEAMVAKGRLYDAKGLWRESTRLYEDVVVKAAGTAAATNARILAGIAYAQGGEHHSAVEYLGGIPLPEEDEEILSKLLFALGDSYFALGNYDNALLSYLPLVVFYPYVHDNEPRGLAAALACYAELKEWEPLYRTIQEIKRLYPGTPAEETANQIIAEYKNQLAQAGQFLDGDRVVEPPAAVADPSTSGNPDIQAPKAP